MNKDNFFIASNGRFTPCETPTRDPDFISFNKRGKPSSSYWYNGDTLIRVSNHWGRVAKCKWVIGNMSASIKKCKIFNFEITASINFNELTPT